MSNEKTTLVIPVVGAQGTGKKSIIRHWAPDGRQANYTIGNEVVQVLVASYNVGGRTVDIGFAPVDAEHYDWGRLDRRTPPAALTAAHGVIFLCSYTDPDSKTLAGPFVKYVKTCNPDIPLVILGTKFLLAPPGSRLPRAGGAAGGVKHFNTDVSSPAPKHSPLNPLNYLIRQVVGKDVIIIPPHSGDSTCILVAQKGRGYSKVMKIFILRKGVPINLGRKEIYTGVALNERQDQCLSTISREHCRVTYEYDGSVHVRHLKAAADIVLAENGSDGNRVILNAVNPEGRLCPDSSTLCLNSEMSYEVKTLSSFINEARDTNDPILAFLVEMEQDRKIRTEVLKADSLKFAKILYRKGPEEDGYEKTNFGSDGAYITNDVNEATQHY